MMACSVLLRLQRASWSLSLVQNYHLQLVRCVSTSVSCLMKRPVFEGPEFPKKPMSAYLLFVADKRGTLPIFSDAAPTDYIKKLAEMWRNLPGSEKQIQLLDILYRTAQIFKDRHLQLKKEHEVEVATFLEGLGSKEEQKKYMDRLAEYRQRRREYIKHYRLKKLGLVKPRKLSGYNAFVKEHGKELVPGSGGHDGMRAVSDKWNSLTEEEKKVYTARADAISTEKLSEYQKKYSEAIAKGIIEPIEEEKTKPKKKKAASTRKKPAPVKSVRKTGGPVG